MLRAVPELLSNLFLVMAFGFGPIPGVLALGLHAAGFLGKFYADDMEASDPAPQKAFPASARTRVRSRRALMKFVRLKWRGGDYLVVVANIAYLRTDENGQTKVGMVGDDAFLVVGTIEEGAATVLAGSGAASAQPFAARWTFGHRCPRMVQLNSASRAGVSLHEISAKLGAYADAGDGLASAACGSGCHACGRLHRYISMCSRSDPFDAHSPTRRNCALPLR